ncbi:uncharacterized protein NFIA_109780 [Aspergillus fischeri NRRL 181]|uniref:Uncharacterized protein n=1 Tax=Neosartorya fischeri (strain ATCC 1020 / DSM 3700 / CBS 544.65 / FGSC A1164 / JCM 1740 / NRRL 181 / WB 181) TaxID=331117 RepID=A1CXY2_NEOFI|nr:conserved hypothetical protein [Aspergillus fischeri NRRL 181]EAW25484.1 conserved hypothetical protein [Aspergillus fischeri NRRL 181]KAG2024474.1 hypothetical protein GB937_003666 [Aspergillus fischeri]
MARFSLSFLALCFFLALVVSALPAKRDDDDLDAGDAVAAALSALRAFENVDKETTGIPDKASAAHGANVKEATTTPQPIPSGTRSTVQTPAAASSSAAAAPKKKQGSTNPLSHIPIIGGVLGGGEGLGSLLPTR